jgi:hypothetical protein
MRNSSDSDNPIMGIDFVGSMERGTIKWDFLLERNGKHRTVDPIIIIIVMISFDLFLNR